MSYADNSLKAVQRVAYDEADKQCPPMEGLTQGEFDEQWLRAFDSKMRQLGWVYTGDHCMCDDPDHGHEAGCGWTKIPANGGIDSYKTRPQN
jgi:hypothetical protein